MIGFLPNEAEITLAGSTNFDIPMIRNIGNNNNNTFGAARSETRF